MEPFLPVPQSVAAEGPKFRRVRRDLEPTMTNEEEVVRAPAKAIEMGVEFWIWIWPNEVPGKDFSKDFGGDACGDAQ